MLTKSSNLVFIVLISTVWNNDGDKIFLKLYKQSRYDICKK